jgi:hypothetical protein
MHDKRLGMAHGKNPESQSVQPRINRATLKATQPGNLDTMTIAGRIKRSLSK